MHHSLALARFKNAAETCNARENGSESDGIEELGQSYDGWRLTYHGYDFLALRAACMAQPHLLDYR